MQDLTQQLAQAQSLRETNKLQESETLYTTILEAHPNQLQAIMGLGYTYRQLGQYARALDSFRQAVTANPNELWPHLAVSEQLRDNRDFAAALAILDTMEHIHPNRWEIFHHRGHIYRTQGDNQPALTCFQTAIKLNPTSLWSHIALAEQFRDKGEFNSALTVLDTIEQHYPNNFEIFYRRGQLYRAQGDNEQALTCFQTAVNLNPDFLWSQLALSELLRDKREFAAALAILDTMEQLHSNRWEIFHHRGYIYRAQGDNEPALTCFQTAIKLNPTSLWSHIALAEQLRDKGEFNSALAVLDTIEQYYPNNFEIWLRRGYLYRMQGNNEQTSACFQTASNLNPNNIGIKLALIDELRQQGKLNQTHEILNEGLLKEPTNPHLLLRHALIHRELGQRAQALITLEQATNIHPKDFQLHLELANELRDQNKLEQSLTEFNFLQQNFPPHFQVLFHLAHLYRRQGNYSQALAYFQKAIAIETNNIHGHIAIVEVLRETQQLDAAWEKLTDIEQRYPQRFETLYQKGLLYRIQNNSDQAIACFQQALTFNPNNFWCQIQLSEELRNQGQFASALTILDTLDAQQPNNFHVLMYKGHLYQTQNDNAQALLYFQKAYELDHSSTNALLQIANEQFKLGAINKAIATLIQNLTQQPSDLWSLLQIGNWLNIANAKEQALSFFNQALAAHPQQLQPYLSAAQLLNDLGYTTEAFNLFEQALKQCGERPEVYLNKSQMLWASRELNAAWQCLEQGLNLFPDNYWLQIRRIDFLIQHGQFGAALQFINSCPADTLDKKLQLQTFAAQIAERQWQIDAAISINQEILKLKASYIPAHEALRRLFVLKLDIEQPKYHAMQIAQYRLGEQKINGQTMRGILHDHVSQITEEYVLNLPVLKQAQQALSLANSEQRLNELATLVQQEPDASAAINAFLAELHQQQYLGYGIPKHIFQYWDSVTPPAAILAFTQSWRKHNPDYSYQLFNEQTARDFLRTNCEPKILRAYSRSRYAAQKADLLRLVLLYEYGGVYADADDRCLKPLAQWLPKEAKIVLFYEEYASVGNNFIACIAKHPIIQLAIEYAIKALLKSHKDLVWLATGPAVVSRALALYLAQHWPQTTPKDLGVVIIAREELMQHVGIHGQLPYKSTTDSWMVKEFKSGKKLDVTQLISQ